MTTTADRFKALLEARGPERSYVLPNHVIIAFAESEARTAAANARREALDEVITMAVSNEQQERNRHWKEAHRCLIAHANELRDASHPAAETQASPSVTTCGAYCAEFGKSCPLPHGHKGMHAAEGLWWPNGDAKEMCEHGRCGKSGWMVRDGRAVVCTCVVPRQLAPPADQPPARDVEGLARVLEPLVLRAIYSNCSYSPSEVARLHAQSIAKEVFAHLDGGPRWLNT